MRSVSFVRLSLFAFFTLVLLRLLIVCVCAPLCFTGFRLVHVKPRDYTSSFDFSPCGTWPGSLQLQSRISAHKWGGADRVLLKYCQEPQKYRATQALGQFASMTQSKIEEKFHNAPSGWSARLALVTGTEEVGYAEGLGNTKKQALKEASIALLHKVIEARLG